MVRPGEAADRRSTVSGPRSARSRAGAAGSPRWSGSRPAPRRRATVPCGRRWRSSGSARWSGPAGAAGGPTAPAAAVGLDGAGRRMLQIGQVGFDVRPAGRLEAEAPVLVRPPDRAAGDLAMPAEDPDGPADQVRIAAGRPAGRVMSSSTGGASFPSPRRRGSAGPRRGSAGATRSTGLRRAGWRRGAGGRRCAGCPRCGPGPAGEADHGMHLADPHRHGAVVRLVQVGCGEREQVALLELLEPGQFGGRQRLEQRLPAGKPCQTVVELVDDGGRGEAQVCARVPQRGGAGGAVYRKRRSSSRCGSLWCSCVGAWFGGQRRAGARRRACSGLRLVVTALRRITAAVRRS